MKPSGGSAPGGLFSRLTGFPAGTGGDGVAALSKRQWTRLTAAHQVRAVVAHRWAVVVLALLGAAGAGAVTLAQTPVYSSTVQLVLTANYPAKDIDQVSRGSNYVLQRINTYATIANNSGVAKAVIDKLGLPYSGEQLMANVTVTTHAGSTAMEISVRDTSAQRASDIANAYGAEFPAFVGKLETPDYVDTAPIRVSVTTPATVPAAPVSPDPVANVALGLLAGLGCGLVLAAVRYARVRTVRDERHATEITGLSLLGAPAVDRAAPLLGADRAATPAAEAFRQIRTNARLRAAGQRLTSIAVVGSVPGDDAAAVAANLALTWARAGDTVVLIDGDFRDPSLPGLFGVPNGTGLADMLSAGTPANHALQQVQPELQLFLLAPGTPMPGSAERLLRTNELTKLMESFRRDGAFVVLLAPPLLANADTLVLLSATDAVAATTRVGFTHSDRLAAALQVLQAIRANVLGIVATRP
ncbi:Wzz/FepE/Etk N-terminal domain-containing protein [Dactylosporangium sp. CS-033363]|uniref:Wzz/FepE/Etk N-terminal domain-containing protein n=1 Tax=Dactylosporangium sp. CS-033363 TaxID=3239935 RepID=UPI003D926D5C